MLVPECISDKERTVSFVNDGVLSTVVDDKTKNGKAYDMKCNSLAHMISLMNQTSIDFWSLDVEGHEMTVLRAVDFSKVDVKLLMVEDTWLSSRELDQYMTFNGFVKYQHLRIDTVFVNRKHFHHAATSVQYPEKFWDGIEAETAYRQQADIKPKIVCT
jgi:hypothetical protein